jgi:hypothetical protein
MVRLPVLLAVLLASACTGNDEAARTVTVKSATTITVTETTSGAMTTTAGPSEKWKGLPEPLPADGTLPVDAFNEHAERVDEPWERNLRGTVDEFIGFAELKAPNVSFQATSGGGPTNASILLDGLLDDSVQARRYDLTLSRRQDGTWRIESAFWAQRCQEGRGHQAFTPAPCI